MINGSSGVGIPLYSQTSAKPLTEEQGNRLTEILSRYDPTSVTSGEAQKIVTEIKEAGINPGKALLQMMSDLGFDAKAIGDAGKPEGDRPPPPPPQSGDKATKGKIDSAAIELLSEIIDSFGDAELTESEWTSVLSRLEENGVDLSEPMVDIRM